MFEKPAPVPALTTLGLLAASYTREAIVVGSVPLRVRRTHQRRRDRQSTDEARNAQAERRRRGEHVVERDAQNLGGRSRWRTDREVPPSRLPAGVIG